MILVVAVSTMLGFVAGVALTLLLVDNEYDRKKRGC